MQRKIILFAAASAAIAVVLGALSAHSLQNLVEKGLLTTKNTHAFDTAADYQLYHSLALLTLSLLVDKYRNEKMFKATLVLFITGIFLFSGSIYILSTRAVTGMDNVSWLGPLTPLGGLCFIAGWISLFITAFTKSTSA
jgi:uncharacterized membrane protein YgdD (TMEM256/DUF423 family)